MLMAFFGRMAMSVSRSTIQVYRDISQTWVADSGVHTKIEKIAMSNRQINNNLRKNLVPSFNI